MNTRNEATNPLQHLSIVQLWHATSSTWADAECKAMGMVQGLAIQIEWPDQRHFFCHQFCREAVLL
jgi:hypothetical protein